MAALFDTHDHDSLVAGGRPPVARISMRQGVAMRQMELPSHGLLRCCKNTVSSTGYPRYRLDVAWSGDSAGGLGS